MRVSMKLFAIADLPLKVSGTLQWRFLCKGESEFRIYKCEL